MGGGRLRVTGDNAGRSKQPVVDVCDGDGANGDGGGGRSDVTA